MKILIISPGKQHDLTVAEGIAEYAKRLPQKFALEWTFPKPDNVDAEGKAILKLLKDGDHVVLLDERGKDVDTPAFAKLLDTRLQSGTKRLVFIIGGAFGVSSEVTARASAMLKLSSLVFPHMLVRLILAEQLYRASSLLDGGKYHHT
ncbi:MAG TPA: 23S rRNA (pseudouridine(1915)-N(3))-methyltransferase RlmH [Candidatus Paceibacterota bacterium]|nr:23S rRNA (pseudouridine(1915)-N(3))-methyltransferase RlmH [Candidatus Paceibacterota bacterium]